MHRTYKALFGLILVLGLTGCATVKTPFGINGSDNFDALKISRSVGGAFGIGEGWSVEIIPPKYGVETIVVGTPTSPELEYVPAIYGWVDGEFPGNSIQVIKVPHTYETIIENVVIQQESQEIILTAPIYGTNGSVLVKASIEQRHIPAKIKRVSRKVVKEQSHFVKWVIPNEIKNGKTKLQLIPVSTWEPFLPQGTYTNHRMVEPRKFSIRNSEGELVHEFDSFEKLKVYLK